MKYCKICNEIIPDGRVKALPGVQTCILHSDMEKKLGFAVISSKTTYSELSIVDRDTYNVLKKFERKKLKAN